ncbi:helix-turn-helix transcriptional regulator [Oricola cellulosilytica]|uniref:YafY family transcriptional regulator n=1 Tax=Oricola cellulosilytica TaxID=1429082 RepID=A0A4R0PDA1_9HYPH|nr:YafY family protein [Oricola cellulosilytica]TCD15471.1 YafY family transcriptional regulator [Oricola cellulosilytica]
MRRADRLFQIVQHLRGGRLVTARKLSGILEVSERTIYRDIADLQSTGVPIDGEAGVGYLMREGFDLPPLMFTRDEVVALVAGARLIKAWGGATIARAAEEALIKIGAVLPEEERDRLRSVEIHAPSFMMRDEDRHRLDLMERAAETRHVIRFGYVDGDGKATERAIRPLGLWFWGGRWTCIGWCLLREDFRMFRIDRIQWVESTTEKFAAERGKSIRDFYARMEKSGDVPPGYDWN